MESNGGIAAFSILNSLGDSTTRIASATSASTKSPYFKKRSSPVMTCVSFAGENREPVIALRKVIGKPPVSGSPDVIHPASRVQAACYVHGRPIGVMRRMKYAL
jgi:hypothetical protein